MGEINCGRVRERGGQRNAERDRERRVCVGGDGHYTSFCVLLLFFVFSLSSIMLRRDVMRMRERLWVRGRDRDIERDSVCVCGRCHHFFLCFSSSFSLSPPSLFPLFSLCAFHVCYIHFHPYNTMISDAQCTQSVLKCLKSWHVYDHLQTTHETASYSFPSHGTRIPPLHRPSLSTLRTTLRCTSARRF